MNCSFCGARLYKNAEYCAHCGSKVVTNTQVEEVVENIVLEKTLTTETKQTNQTQKKYSGKAITGFVLSLSGWFLAGIICGILGIIFSSIALSDIKRKNYNGKGLAIAGLIVSIVLLVVSTISTIYKYFNYLSYYLY